MTRVDRWKIDYPVELSADPQFKRTVERMVKRYAIEEIVETGTGTGRGSTLIFALTGLPVCSIECNGRHCAMAKIFLRGYPNVSIMHSYSLKYKEMVEFITQDALYEENLSLKREGGKRPRQFYLQEITCGAPVENVLNSLLRRNKRQLILLDSAGGVGLLEFKQFMSLPSLKKKILLLDDVQHVKHYRSVKILKEKGVQFHYSRSRRWGWADFF